MKKYAIFLFTLLFFISCKEKATEEVKGEVIGLSANMTALPRKGMNLRIAASLINCKPANYSLSFIHENDTLRESIGITNMVLNKTGVIYLSEPNGQSCDTIPSIAMGFSRMQDLFMGSFYPARNKPNTITIHHFDPLTNVVKGALDVTFLAEPNSYGRSFYPDTFRLKCDAFTVQLK